MSHESTDLKLYMDNDYGLYSDNQRTSIIDNLLKRKNSGKYDSAKSVKLWGYYVETGAKKYAKDFGGTWHKIFSIADRKQVAREFRDDFESGYREGEYAQRQREVETKAQRKARTGSTGKRPGTKKGQVRKTARRAYKPKSGGSCTKADVEKMFKSTVMPSLIEAEAYDGIPDRPMRREAWNNWIDGLQKDGTITERQADTWGHPKWLETWKGKR